MYVWYTMVYHTWSFWACVNLCVCVLSDGEAFPFEQQEDSKRLGDMHKHHIQYMVNTVAVYQMRNHQILNEY